MQVKMPRVAQRQAQQQALQALEHNEKDLAAGPLVPYVPEQA